MFGEHPDFVFSVFQFSWLQVSAVTAMRRTWQGFQENCNKSFQWGKTQQNCFSWGCCFSGRLFWFGDCFLSLVSTSFDSVSGRKVLLPQAAQKCSEILFSEKRHKIRHYLKLPNAHKLTPKSSAAKGLPEHLNLQIPRSFEIARCTWMFSLTPPAQCARVITKERS